MIRVVASGLFSTIQDLGRFGHRHHGVPVSGAMDSGSAKFANALLGNRENAAFIEFTASGPVLEFAEAAWIAITGAAFLPLIDGAAVDVNKAVFVEKGSRLSFKKPEKGLRGYIAIAGGFKSEEILGSCCFYKGITPLTKLRSGVSIEYDQKLQKNWVGPLTQPGPSIVFTTEEIEAYKGPEYELLEKSIQNKIQKTYFHISPQSNRMAYMLKHSQEISAGEIITAAVRPGTVQLTPSGAVHILMRDAQTTGGYARILQLTERAIDILAQKRAGDRVRFKIFDPPFDIPF